MKKSICLIMVFILMLALSSCTKGGTLVHFFEDKDTRLVNTRMEQLFNAIKEQDKSVLKEAFSQKAIEEAEDIDVEIDSLLSFVQGEVVSWSKNSLEVYDSVEYGKKLKQLSGWYGLETTEQTYLIFLVDYPIDTMNVENEGLYSLMIIEAEDENKLTGTWEDWTIPGIYIVNN